MANHVNGLDEIDMEYTLDAWGDVPPLHARELYAQYDATRAEFVAPDTCHKLHARIAELERERDAANKRAEQAEAERDELANTLIEASSAFNLDGSRDDLDTAQFAIVRMAHMGAAAMKERDKAWAASVSVAHWKYQLERMTELFLCANAAKRQMRRERDAESKRAEQFHVDARALAEALSESAYTVLSWGGYANEYFKEKHDLEGDLQQIGRTVSEHGAKYLGGAK